MSCAASAFAGDSTASFQTSRVQDRTFLKNCVCLLGHPPEGKNEKSHMASARWEFGQCWSWPSVFPEMVGH